jgi:hypothetical protein
MLQIAVVSIFAPLYYVADFIGSELNFYYCDKIGELLSNSLNSAIMIFASGANSLRV